MTGRAKHPGIAVRVAGFHAIHSSIAIHGESGRTLHRQAAGSIRPSKTHRIAQTRVKPTATVAAPVPAGGIQLPAASGERSSHQALAPRPAAPANPLAPVLLNIAATVGAAAGSSVAGLWMIAAALALVLLVELLCLASRTLSGSTVGLLISPG